MDSQLQDLPSSLIRLIRNFHAHASQKWRMNPKGFIKTLMFPNRYSDKQAFVIYWIERFPKLFHVIAALTKNQVGCRWLDWSSNAVEEEVVDSLKKALDFERDHGKEIT